MLRVPLVEAGAGFIETYMRPYTHGGKCAAILILRRRLHERRYCADKLNEPGAQLRPHGTGRPAGLKIKAVSPCS